MKKTSGAFAALALTALVFAVCLIVPALMLDGGQEPGEATPPVAVSDLSAAERASLYERYESGELERSLLVGELDSDITMASMKRIGALESALVCDRGAVRSVASTGRVFLHHLGRHGQHTHPRILPRVDGRLDELVHRRAGRGLARFALLLLQRRLRAEPHSYSGGQVYEIGGLMGSIGAALDMDDYEVRDAVEDGEPFELKYINSVSGEERSFD